MYDGKSPSWSADELHVLELARKTPKYIGAPLIAGWVDYCAQNISDFGCTAPGFGIELTKTLCDRLKINCLFKFFNATEWEAGGLQNFMAGKIDSREVHTFVPLLTPTPTLVETLNFTFPAYFLEDGLLYKSDFVYTADSIFVLKPFTTEVWICILLSLLLVVFLDGFYKLVDDCCRPSDFSAKRYLINIERNWLGNFAVLLQRNADSGAPSCSWPRRFLMIGWGISALLLGSTYSAMLVSNRVWPVPQNPIRSLSDFVFNLEKSNVRMVVYEPDSVIIRRIEEHEFPVYRDLHFAMKANPPTYISNISTALNLIRRGKSGRVVLYGNLLTLKHAVGTNCNYTVIPLGIKRMGSFGFRRNSSRKYSILFTKVILKFQERGYYFERLNSKYDFASKCAKELVRKVQEGQTGENESTELKSRQIQGLTTMRMASFQLMFWALLVGYVAGGLCLIVEILVVRYKKDRSEQSCARNQSDIN